MADKKYEVLDNTFEEKVIQASHTKPVLVDFWADWCNPCKMLSPIVEEIATENADKLTLAKIETEEAPETTEQYNVMSIPTLILFKDGQMVKQLIGYMPKERIMSQLAQYL
jgi:thioredoxin 1